MAYPIEPRNEYVLIERLAKDEPSGAIVIPEVAKEKSIRGRVLAVGPGKWIEGINGGSVRKTPEVKVGDIVLFNSKWSEFAGSHYSDDQLMDRKLHLVMENDIFCRVNEGQSRHDQGRVGRAGNQGTRRANSQRKAVQENTPGR